MTPTPLSSHPWLTPLPQMEPLISLNEMVRRIQAMRANPLPVARCPRCGGTIETQVVLFANGEAS